MSKKDEVREFLISRRANVTPEQAGLPDVGERRVPGLRREEVAMLAGVSTDYYTRLERGKICGASDSVLNAIARALRLGDVERERLFDLARFIFLDSRARDFYADWPPACSLAMLRFEAGRDPRGSDLTALIGELSTRSPQFRKNWAEQDVHEHRTGRKVYRHPELGELDITYDVFDMPGEPGLSIATYTAEEGTATADKLALLASWATAEELGAHRPSPA